MTFYAPHLMYEDLVGVLNDAGLLVGENIAPVEGGWLQGQPNVSAFRPYTVLMLLSSSQYNNPAGLSGQDWRTTLSMRTFGGSWQQVSRTAHAAREALFGYRGAISQATDWHVIHTHIQDLGSLQRVDQTDPPYWQVYDGLTIEVGKIKTTLAQQG